MGPTLLTLREITRLCPGFRLHQVKYAVDEYGIAPHSRVGIIRLWTEDDLPRIKSALHRIAQRRGGVL